MSADASIVLPVLDRAMPTLRLIDHLVGVCPEETAFDLVLVVGPAVDAVDRDRLRALGGDVTVVESTSSTYGAGVLAGAAQTTAPTLLLVDVDARPDCSSVVAALAAATLVQGVAGVPRSAVDDHADLLRALPDFGAAAPLLVHARRRPCTVAPGPDLAVPTGGEIPVVLVARGDAAALADRLTALRDAGTRPRLVTVVDAGLTPAARSAATRFGAGLMTPPPGSALSAYVEDVVLGREAGWVAVVDGDVTVSRFWLAGLVGALTGDPRAAAAAATSNRGPAVQRVEGVGYGDRRGFRAFADDVRRRNAGRSDVTGDETGDVGGGCLLVSADAVRQAATLARRPAPRCWSPADLLRRLSLLGYHARVARDVYVDHAFDGSCAGPLLTATLIVKNEQAMLPGCLQSVHEVADEVVVVDTGSADATVAIAERMGARVGAFAWCDDFAAARNAALARCGGPWALWIDADERADCAAPSLLRGQLAADAADAFWVTINSFHGTRTADAEVRGLPAHRLFRADLVTFTGRVHERPIALPGAQVREAVVDGFALDHLGYLDQITEDRQKTDRNLHLATLRAGEEGGWLAQFELGRASLKAGRIEEGIAALDAALTGRESASTHVLLGLQLMGNGYLELGRFEEAAATAARGLRHNAGHPGLVLVRTVALEALGRFDEALAASAAQLDPTLAAAAPTDVCTLQCLRGGLLVLTENRPAAAEVLTRTAREFPTLFEPWPVLVRLLRTLHPQGWPARVLACAGPDSFRLLDAIPGLADADRARLAGATAELLPALAQRLVDRGEPDAVRRAATALETSRPELALALWRALPGTAGHAGELRCLVALGQLAAAATVLSRVPAQDLGPADALFAATLAAHLGDRARATELLAVAERGGADAALVAEVSRAAGAVRAAS